MNPEDNQDNSGNQEEKKRVLPTYVFGEDYKQTVNLAGEQNTEDKSTEQDAAVPEDKPENTDANEEVHSESVNMSINSELEKIEAEKPEPTPVIATKKKAKRKTTTIVLFIIVVALGATFGIFMLLKGSGTIGATQELSCEMTGNNNELLNSGNAAESKSSVEVSYSNGEFSYILQTFEAKFEDSSTAKIAMNNVRSEYIKRFKSFGIATEPFKSEYNQNNESIIVTHYADTNMINSDNAGVLHIDTNKNKVIIYDIDSIKKNYEDLGYACSVH